MTSFLVQAHKASILHCLGRVLSLFEVGPVRVCREGSGAPWRGWNSSVPALGLQDEEKKQQARDLFEASADQGCLPSSYLLWESDRGADVSDRGGGLVAPCAPWRRVSTEGSSEPQELVIKVTLHDPVAWVRPGLLRGDSRVGVRELGSESGGPRVGDRLLRICGARLYFFHCRCPTLDGTSTASGNSGT